MSDGIDIDTHEFRVLAGDFAAGAARLLPLVDGVMKKGAQNVKDAMVADATSSGSFHQIGKTISYDRAVSLTEIGYEIGPDRRRGGAASLAGAYFGWPAGGGASLDLDGPLRAEEPGLVKALGDALGGVL